MKTLNTALVLGALLCAGALSAAAQDSYSWRYYRVGNTGIQGDDNAAVWVGPDGDPYIAGYNAPFEEGGFAKFIQSENRWVNYSNVDYPVIGHPDETGCVRLTDIVPDATGKLWMGTWLGALRFDPAVGASSITRFTPGNSKLDGSTVLDVERAPDGTMWFANNGCVRYDPTADTWTQFNKGNVFLAAQPKATGGYFIWSGDYYFGTCFRYDSTAGTWITWTPQAAGDVAGLPGKDCVDDAGNLWALRMPSVPGDWEKLGYRRPDGTWVMPAPPYASVTFDIWAFKAYGDRRALLVDGAGTVYQFDGTTWLNLGVWRPGLYTEAADIDSLGNVWVCGVGGAARRDVQTGQWQRYRITNTGQFDYFNNDVAIDQATGAVYACANASAGIGGVASFDGARWTCWNPLTYGLGDEWPFLTDNCRALTVRPSNGRLVVSPSDWIYGIHEWTGTDFVQLPGNDGTLDLVEDSGGRLWAAGGATFGLSYYTGAGWTPVPGAGAGTRLKKDPTRSSTVWAADDYNIVRTDGTDSFARTIADFPGSAAWFTGLAPDTGGVSWIGTWSQFTQTGSTLIRLDANTGAFQTWRHDQGWPFPGEHVRPHAVTPDGRLWMQYDSEYPSNRNGICWWDGTTVVAFPAPPGGVPQWGGLPNSTVEDFAVREIPGGYELWMACLGRGIAVLTVQHPTAVTPPAEAPAFALAPNAPNPFRSSTRVHFSLPRAGHVRLSVLDVSGRVVRTLLDGETTAGRHDAEWDGRDATGRSVSSGVYFCEIQGAGQSLRQRMIKLN